MRHALLTAAGAAVVATALTAIPLAASAAPSRPAPPFTVTANVVGGPQEHIAGAMIVFSFAMKNNQSRSTPDPMLYLESPNGSTLPGVALDQLSCTTSGAPGGYGVSADGFWCEPGVLAAHQTEWSTVIVTPTALGPVSITACEVSQATGATVTLCRTATAHVYPG